jgi:hypothetical protein
VGVYCRLSIDPSAQRLGVERQREDNLALAGERWPGWSLEENVTDRWEAPATTSERS